MYPYLSEVPILITFFVRPEKFRLVFECIREVRPKILFLVSDGPRVGYPDDARLNAECKKIAENIDWECQVYRRYSDVNLGIDNNSYWGLKWAFQFVDRVIFLEDDILPSQDFFRFCSDLLEKYLEDKRIFMICGMNHLGVYHKPKSDYFFSRAGSIWGFAIWKRSFELFDEQLEFFADEYAKQLIDEHAPNIFKRNYQKAEKRKNDEVITGERVSSFELMCGAAFLLNNGLFIVSTKNLVSCIGISENSGHSVNNAYKIPIVTRNLFFMKTYEIQFPLNHPKYIAADMEYEKAVYKIMGNSLIVRLYRKIETRTRVVIVELYEKIFRKNE